MLHLAIGVAASVAFIAWELYTPRALLGRDPRPTALACSSLIMSLGVVRAVRDLGLAIPADVSLIAHDDVFPWLKPENFSVPLSTTLDTAV